MTKLDNAEATTPSIRELTVRGVVLGGVITLIFTAANVYLGLKVGLTFATAIPAAVISMAILRYFRGHTILENNIVQTIASAAGTLAAIIFVLPGLIMIGWWTGFPYWITVAVCIVGGILGVMYSVPLRRALVTGSDLPYPEGVAAAEVLQVGEAAVDGGEGNKRSLRAIIVGSAGGSGVFTAGRHEGDSQRHIRLLPPWRRRFDDRREPVAGTDRRRPSRRRHRRLRDDRRFGDLLLRVVADPDVG